MDEGTGDVTSKEVFRGIRKKKSAADTLKAVFDSFVNRTWYYARKKQFFYWEPKTGEIHEFGKDDFRELLASKGFFSKLNSADSAQNGIGEKEKKKADKNSWMRFVEEVWTSRHVDGVGEIAGHYKGIVKQGNEKILILKGPELILPKPSCEPSFNWLLCEQLLGEAFPHVILWLKRGYLSIQTQEHSFGQVLILVGPTACGKSCFQHGIITPFFGGRSASAFKYLCGKTQFNKAFAKSEHAYLDDHSCTDVASQRILEEGIKRMASSAVGETEAKGVDAITSHALMQRLSVSINDEPHNLSMLPAIRADNEDKIILVGCVPTQILAGLTEAEIRQKLEEGQQSFVSEVLQYEAPEKLLNSEEPAEQRAIKRFGFATYIDKKYREEINRESQAESLRRLILEVLSGSASQPKQGYPSVLHAQLTSDILYGEAIKKIAGSVSYFGTLMAELAKEYPTEFEIIPARKGRTYKLTAPEQPKQVDPKIQIS